MTTVEELLLAELHAGGDPAVLDRARRNPECARVLAALDLVVWDLHQLGHDAGPPVV